jgi:hypothetical protein
LAYVASGTIWLGFEFRLHFVWPPDDLLGIRFTHTRKRPMEDAVKVDIKASGAEADSLFAIEKYRACSHAT